MKRIALVLLFLATHAFAQSMVPVPAVVAQLGDRCAPGFFGEQWPGSKFDFGTRTANGWFAYAFCKAPTTGKMVAVLRLCAHGECLPQPTYWGTVGNLLVGAVSRPRIDVANEWQAQNPLAWQCLIYPPGGTPPPPPPNPLPAGTLPVADPGTLRAMVCADALAAIQAAWPMMPAPPPPPPPPQAGWVAYGGTIFKIVNGKLATVVAVRTATKGAQCSGINVATVGTFVYQQLVGGFADEATRCVKPTTAGAAASDTRLAIDRMGDTINEARRLVAEAIALQQAARADRALKP